MKLSGKVAIVTGSGAGIGRAIATTFGATGAKVVIADRHLDRTEQVAGEIQIAGGEGVPFEVDCCEEEDVARLFDVTIERFGRLDILVNNAVSGSKDGLGAAAKAFIDTSPQDWDISLRGYLRGYVICSLRAAKEMVKQGKGGKIIHIGSVAANVALNRASAYCTAKAALQGLTRSMAMELAPYKINVNVINPALINTKKVMNLLPPTDLEQWLASIPLGRYGEPADVASTALFLASADADFITGQAFTVDGGFLAAGII